MTRMPDASVPPKLPARALPRGKATQERYGTGHIIGWKSTIFFASLFVAFMIILYFL